MTLSRIHFGLILAATCALAGGAVWEARDTAKWRAEATRQQLRASTQVAALEQDVAKETQRVAAAEARVAALLQAAKQPAVARTPAPAEADIPLDTAAAVKEVLARGKELVSQGKPRDAIDEYVRLYLELQAIRPGSSECQSLMSALKSLSRSNPEARVALTGLRDAALQQRLAQPARSELAFEIALLNRHLDEGHQTIALYDTLAPSDRTRDSLASIAREAFIAARRYSDALRGKSYGRMLSEFDAGRAAIDRMPSERQTQVRNSVVDGTLANIEVLTGAGMDAEAGSLTEKLLAFDATEATRSALQQRVDRARSAQR
jgi:hypothetical protein